MTDVSIWISIASVAIVPYVIATTFYFRLRKLSAILEMAKNEYTRMLEFKKNLETTLEKSKEKENALLEKIQIERLNTAAEREQLYSSLEKHLADKESLNAQLQKVTESLGNMEAQYASAVSQCRALDTALGQAKRQNVQTEQLENDLSLLSTKAKEHKLILDQVQLENLKLKHRLRVTEQLYITMKGLKEMAEEKSHNRELALEKLAAFVLPSLKSIDTLALDQKVTQALEHIGTSLVEIDL